jgi:hypothetical protein
MVNPYDRLSAFKNRKIRRKLVSMEDLEALHKKQVAAMKEAARLKTESERMVAEDTGDMSEPEGPRIPMDNNRERSRPEVSGSISSTPDDSFMSCRCLSLPSQPRGR